jgi:peptidyl-prolyl cis-trans isomerase D
MFDSVRKHQRILQLVLVIVIFPAFALWGVQGYDTFFNAGKSVAKVGGSEITRQEYDTARQRQLEQLRQTLGGQVDPALVDGQGMRAEILEGLITRRALWTQAVEQGVRVSDQTLQRTILAIPELLRPDGSFDMDRYRSLLNAQGRNEAAFEQELRHDLAMQALPGAISQTVTVPDALVDRIARLGEQQREIRQREFPPSAFAAEVDVSDAALERFYEQNAAAFEAPEQASIQYVVLDPAAIESSIPLNLDEVRAYYEQNKARYATPEQRRASHILIAVPAGADEATKKAAHDKAEAILAKLRSGADFAELAKTESQDAGSAPSGGDLGYFDASMMVKPFADAAFALQKGQISDVIETEFGFHIIRLTDIRPGSERPFDAVRSDIEAEIRKQQSAGRLAEASETFSNLVYEQSDSLQPAADRFGLKIQTADAVRRDGVPTLPKDDPLNQRRFLQSLFSPDSIANKRNTEAVDVGGGKLISARILEYHPARHEPLAEVRDEVRRELVARESALAAKKAGEELLAALKAGKAEVGDQFGAPRTVARAPSETLSRAAIDAIFRADSSSLPSYVGAGTPDGGYAVFEVLKVIDASDKVLDERRALYRRQLEEAYRQAALNEYIESVKARTEIVRNLAATEPTATDR